MYYVNNIQYEKLAKEEIRQRVRICVFIDTFLQL